MVRVFCINSGNYSKGYPLKRVSSESFDLKSSFKPARNICHSVFGKYLNKKRTENLPFVLLFHKGTNSFSWFLFLKKKRARENINWNCYNLCFILSLPKVNCEWSNKIIFKCESTDFNLKRFKNIVEYNSGTKGHKLSFDNSFNCRSQGVNELIESVLAFQLCKYSKSSTYKYI